MATITRAQIGAIHSLKGRAGLDDGDYRSLLLRETGKDSSTALDKSQAGRLIEQLRVLAGGSQTIATPDFSGPYAAIGLALWISGYNLGVFDQREDAALLAFVRRQTGIDHLNWVRDHQAGSAVVDALKAWLARAGGVVWPTGKADSSVARKRAVIAAQLTKLGSTMALPPDGELDKTIVALGRRVRKAQAMNVQAKTS